MLTYLLFLTVLTTQPDAPATTQAAYEPGLVMEMYALPRRPKRVRESIVGLVPKAVRLAKSPVIGSRDDVPEIVSNVQVDFVGEIQIPTAGEYAFSVQSDDGTKLEIDGERVLADAWVNGPHHPTRATVKLEEGWRPIRVRFYQGDGGFGLEMKWRPPGAEDFVEIPADRFRVSSDLVAAAKAKLDPATTQASSDDPNVVYRAVFSTRGFFELPEVEGDLLVDLLEGPTLYSRAARKDFAETVRQTNYEKLPYWHQVKVLAGFLRGWYSGSTDRGPVTTRASYTISDAEPVEYDGWNRAKRQGFRHRVTIEDKTYTIYTPAADSVERESVAQGIAGLPKSLRILMNTVTVEPYGTANEFNGGGDHVWVRRRGPTNVELIDNTFSHEIGHVVMNKTDCYLEWEQAIAKDVLSPSHYARENPSEDFAEFMRMYLSTQGEEKQIASLRKLFPARIEVMERVLKKVEFAWIDSKRD